MTALDLLAPGLRVLVVSELESFRLRSLRQLGHHPGPVAAVSTWTRALPHLGAGPVAVLADVRTVTRHRELVLSVMAGTPTRLLVVGSRAPLPRWLEKVNAIAVGARDMTAATTEGPLA